MEKDPLYFKWHPLSTFVTIIVVVFVVSHSLLRMTVFKVVLLGGNYVLDSKCYEISCKSTFTTESLVVFSFAVVWTSGKILVIT